MLAVIAGRIALLVIDAAHYLSDWGLDFRLHDRLIERIAPTLPANLRLLDRGADGDKGKIWVFRGTAAVGYGAHPGARADTMGARGGDAGGGR